MVIYGVFPDSKPVVTAPPVRQHGAPEKQDPQARRDPAVPQAANDSDEYASPSLARSFHADWWPLLIAGIVVALMI